MNTQTKTTLESYKVGTTNRYYDGNKLTESKVKEVRTVGNVITVMLENFYKFEVVCH
tara:strand:+ start:1038 stop:1208 length:171 start_codon:yes stop_codon:yes gene_type:complete